MRAREIISDRDKALSGLLRFRATLDASPDAVFLIDPREMKFIDFNRAVEEITGYSRDELLKMGPGDIKPLFSREARQDLFESLIQGSGAQNTLDTVHQHKDGRRFPMEVKLSVFEQETGEPLIIALARDLTVHKKAEEKLRESEKKYRYINEELLRANRALKVISACGIAIIHADKEDELLQKICNIIVEEAGYRLAWVGCAAGDEKKSVRPAARAGFEDGYPGSIKIEGREPAGTAIRTGSPCIIRDIETDERSAAWRGRVVKRGYESVIGLPLKLRDNPFGALAVYSTDKNAFDSNETKPLMELAGNLAFGIGALRTRSEQKKAEEALIKAYEQLEIRVRERTA